MDNEIYELWFLDALDEYYKTMPEDTEADTEFDRLWKEAEAEELEELKRLKTEDEERELEEAEQEKYMLHSLEKIPAKRKKSYATYFKNSF